MKLFSQDFQHRAYCFKLVQECLLEGRLYIYGSPEYIHPGFIPAFVYGQDVMDRMSCMRREGTPTGRRW